MRESGRPAAAREHHRQRDRPAQGFWTNGGVLSPGAASRWNDDRLDELNGKVRRLEPIATEVAVIKAEMSGLRRDLRENTTATHEVATQLEKVQLGSATKRIAWWGQVLLMMLGALVAGGFAIVAALIASGQL